MKNKMRKIAAMAVISIAATGVSSAMEKQFQIQNSPKTKQKQSRSVKDKFSEEGQFAKIYEKEVVQDLLRDVGISEKQVKKLGALALFVPGKCCSLESLKNYEKTTKFLPRAILHILQDDYKEIQYNNVKKNTKEFLLNTCFSDQEKEVFKSVGFIEKDIFMLIRYYQDVKSLYGDVKVSYPKGSIRNFSEICLKKFGNFPKIIYEKLKNQNIDNPYSLDAEQEITFIQNLKRTGDIIGEFLFHFSSSTLISKDKLPDFLKATEGVVINSYVKSRTNYELNKVMKQNDKLLLNFIGDDEYSFVRTIIESRKNIQYQLFNQQFLLNKNVRLDDIPLPELEEVVQSYLEKQISGAYRFAAWLFEDDSLNNKNEVIKNIAHSYTNKTKELYEKLFVSYENLQKKVRTWDGRSTPQGYDF